MLPRKYLSPNNRSLPGLQNELQHGVAKAKFPKSKERASIFAYLRSGRPAQDDGASGGGRIVSR